MFRSSLSAGDPRALANTMLAAEGIATGTMKNAGSDASHEEVLSFLEDLAFLAPLSPNYAAGSVPARVYVYSGCAELYNILS